MRANEAVQKTDFQESRFWGLDLPGLRMESSLSLAKCAAFFCRSSLHEAADPLLRIPRVLQHFKVVHHAVQAPPYQCAAYRFVCPRVNQSPGAWACLQ